MLTAITRGVSPTIAACELTFLQREAIDVARARQQHRTYEACLLDLGVEVISLPAEAEYPDAVFVEDACPRQLPITSSLRSSFQSGWDSASSAVNSERASNSLGPPEPSLKETNPNSSKPAVLRATAGT